MNFAIFWFKQRSSIYRIKEEKCKKRLKRSYDIGIYFEQQYFQIFSSKEYGLSGSMKKTKGCGQGESQRYRILINSMTLASN